MRQAIAILVSGIWMLASQLIAADALPTGEPIRLEVNCSKVIGEIRPLHGANGGPICDGEMVDLTEHYRRIGIPYLRLHDCHWPNPDVVDIHAIFPNFQADPTLPESYDFRRTDDYLRAITISGARIVYRLGESIEHTKIKYRVNPPSDYKKWAEICIGIIKHYNEGWANGFHHNIQYWEIWNEPENRPAMWTGSDEEFFRLYEVASKAIKNRFPGLKVGGPALGYTGKIENGVFEPGDYMRQFLDRCRERSLPLDFFSWHLYTADPGECLVRASGIRELLDEKGFPNSEMHLNEWNYLPDNDWMPMGLQGQGIARERFYERMGGMEGASFTAAALINLQDSRVDLANFYSAEISGFGLFTASAVPRKNFYAMAAFQQLLATPVRLQSRSGQPARAVICSGANSGKSELQALVSIFKTGSSRYQLSFSQLPWGKGANAEIWVLDLDHNLQKDREIQTDQDAVQIEGETKGPAVVLVKLRPK